jgi:N-methylhydantoinase A/oxoprolinase/acetone carboxylase beta subunit
MPYRLGVDVGGTFTDLILVDEKSDPHGESPQHAI